MKLYYYIWILLIIGIGLNFIDYNLFLNLLSVVWYIASILIIYLAIKSSIKYKFKQINIKEIIIALKSKSNNNISPIASLCISLAAKIGVGSLSGIALAIYFGGIGTIFWLIIISLFVSINTFLECVLGINYREKINNRFVGGPSYYIKKCLGNKKLSRLYSILVIISYSILFLSVQSNTIISVSKYIHINSLVMIIILLFSTLLIILNGISSISKVNQILVPIMLLLYFIIGIYIVIINYHMLPSIIYQVIKEAFNFKSIIATFLIGMQRAIFITESSLGTSAISASSCDNNPSKQGMIEVFGIHLTVFLICLTTFIIIVTSDYNNISFGSINGIEIVIYAFNYHFGDIGGYILSVITLLFAFSTIISSYYFGESNLYIFSKSKYINIIFKIIFMIIILLSCFIKPYIIWNLTDYFVAILAIINVYAIIKIEYKMDKLYHY